MNIKEITPKELKIKLEKINPPTLVDVREGFEREIVNIGGIHIPLGELPLRFGEIPKEGEVVIYCKAGGRSGMAIQELQMRYGYTNLVNLKGGILKWVDEVDPSLKKY